MYLISDHRSLDALQEIWIIGDKLVAEGMRIHQEMFERAGHHRDQEPFVYQWYDVKHYFQPLSSEDNILSKVTNSLIEALNSRKKLPSLILVLMDEGIISSNKELGDFFTKRLINDLDRLVRTRKDQFGSLKYYNADDGRFVIVKSLPVPDNFPSRKKLWSAIEDRRSLHRNIDKEVNIRNNFLAVNVDFKPGDHYLYAGHSRRKLSEQGWIEYWETIDGIVASIDERFEDKNKKKNKRKNKYFKKDI